MCGIFGFVAREGAPVSPQIMRRLLLDLFQRSEPRGQEASGLVVIADGQANVFKRPLAPNAFMRHPGFRSFLDGNLKRGFSNGEDTLDRPMAAIGHCRLVTNGAEVVHDNNQPVVVDHIVGIHNGIVTNEATLVSRHGNMRRTMDVDSEALFRLLDSYLDEGADLSGAIAKTFDAVEGTASVAFFRDDIEAVSLATNNGSLFFVCADELQATFFASEGYILRSFLDGNAGLIGKHSPVQQIDPGAGCIVPFETASALPFRFDDPVGATGVSRLPAPAVIADRKDFVPNIIRCTSCILPATYPFIEFDEHGVCNYCRNHINKKMPGREALERELEKYRSKDGSPDCLVAFSGGRDSSYGLHLLKTEFGMNPVAFSYDWGMVTGIARRNQARMCGKLGVEHILRAADIPAKRRYIRKNIHAWLKRPHLGMVPLFMAGDKEFYEIARQLKRETGIPLVVFCAGNELERTDFKGGFAGARENQHGQRLFGLSLSNKLTLAGFYLSQYLLNPSYLNESFYDSLRAYVTTFIRRDDFLYLFHYLDWNEDEINKTLIGQYGWETSETSDNTWRIGDGYTAFINYIFQTVAGFTEYDTFRSQQIRYGILGRDEAMKLVAQDSLPQMPELREFAQQVGINLEEVLRQIDGIPKLY